MTFVVHCKKEKFDVYIGRPSKYGNPFSDKNESLAKYKVGSREEAIQKYADWLCEPEQEELLKDIQKNLKGKILGCWCKPKDCHGDVLSFIANGANK